MAFEKNIQASRLIGLLDEITALGVGGGIAGSGTINYLSKWNSSTSITACQVFDDGTNVGIGTATPASKFHIKDASTLISVAQTIESEHFTADLILNSFTNGAYTSGGSRFFLQENSIDKLYIGVNNANSTSLIESKNGNNLVLANTQTGGMIMNFFSTGAATHLGVTTNTTNVMWISQTGNVGIGTSFSPYNLPSSRLQVIGGTHIELNDTVFRVDVGGSAGQVLFYRSADISFLMNPYPSAFNTSFRFLSNPTGASYEAGIEHTVKAVISANTGNIVGEVLNIGSTGSFTGNIYGKFIQKSNYLNTDAKFYPLVALGGNVGIGTTTPTATLGILGDASTNLLMLNNSYGLYNNKLRVDNDGSIFTCSDNVSGSGVGGAATGTFHASHLNFKFDTSFSTYLAFTNAGGAGNKTSYGIIGSTISNAESDYRLVILNDDGGTLGSTLKLISTSGSTSNDGFDYYTYGVNIISHGVHDNAGVGNFYKIGLNVDISGSNINYAALFNGGNVGIGTTTPTAVLGVVSASGSPSEHIFKASSSTFVNAMTYIDSIGNLTVRGTDGSYTNILSYHAVNDAYVTIDGASSSILQLTRNTANRFKITSTNADDVRHYHYVNTIHFLYSNSRILTDDNKEIMYHEYASGRTGIGTISPSTKLEVNGDIKTAQPSANGAGAWKLGKKVTATVSLVTTDYIEVGIDGVVYKLALVS